ncbi:MAG: zinc ribbon domain-containing protein [Clostridia bacterium]|nr:zinc ribbon domain-containing protein [Clostridia bacterium]
MEKIISDLKQTFNSAVKKSGELVEFTKAKLAATDIKNNIQTRYAKLGELAYLTAKGEDVSAEIAENLVAEIDELKIALAEKEAKAADLSNKKVCASCGKASPAEASFCPACGNPFTDAE